MSEPGGVELTELLGRAQAGDDNAINELCRVLAPSLRRWTSGRLPAGARDLRQTSDLVMEVLTRSLPRLRNFEPRNGTSLVNYLRRAIMNGIRDEIRRMKRRGRRLDIHKNLPDTNPDALDATLATEERERYEQIVARLRPVDRLALSARLEAGLDYERIALLLNKPTAEAARIAIRRALARFGREFKRG